jgi:hypothetical protein
MQEAQAGVCGEVARIERELAAFGACVETAQAKLDALFDMALTAGKSLLALRPLAHAQAVVRHDGHCTTTVGDRR